MKLEQVKRIEELNTRLMPWGYMVKKADFRENSFLMIVKKNAFWGIFDRQVAEVQVQDKISIEITDAKSVVDLRQVLNDFPDIEVWENINWE